VYTVVIPSGRTRQAGCTLQLYMRDGQRKYEIYNTLEVKNLKG